MLSKYKDLLNLLNGKWQTAWPHDMFDVIIDEDNSIIHARKGQIQTVGIWSLRCTSELRPQTCKMLGIPQSSLTEQEDKDWFIKTHGRKVNDLIWTLMAMMEFGIVNTSKYVSTSIPSNRAERRRISREEAYAMLIQLRPHTHVKQRIEKILKERKAEPYFCQKVRSHLRRLSDNRTTIVKEHKRFAHLPERPQNYNATYLAMKSKICRPCVNMELQNGT